MFYNNYYIKMPIKCPQIIFQYNPSDIRDYNIYYTQEAYNDDMQLPNESQRRKDFYHMYWLNLKYEKYQGYKTNIVNTIASTLLIPFDLVKATVITLINGIVILTQTICHSPIVLYFFCYNSLVYLDDYLLKKGCK
jgi:hypothetical protein